MSTRLILARHAQPAKKAQGCFLGSTDVPLTDVGMQQAGCLSAIVRDMSPDACFVSPMQRARQTARELPHQIDADIREIDFGLWEQKNFQEISADASPELMDQWARFDRGFTFPQGENIGKFVDRVAAVTERLVRSSENNIAVVSHGGVIRIMICLLLGIDPSKYLSFDVDYASITEMKIADGRGVLARLNDTSHLAEVH